MVDIALDLLADGFREEAYLKGHYGRAYEQYCHRVRRYFSGLGATSPAMHQPSFAWRLTIKSELLSVPDYASMRMNALHHPDIFLAFSWFLSQLFAPPPWCKAVDASV